MGLYERIRDIAKDNGYSINRLEQELGFSRSSINKFNKNAPSIDKLKRIADLLGVSVDYLTTGKEHMFDYLYSDENADFLIELTTKMKDPMFMERMKKYVDLQSEDRKSVDDMIDFIYEKRKRED